jgi:dTDP-4-amino-4,6-dideoxygalactose transaminase
MIPFNKPAIVGNEVQYITESVQLGHTSGDGTFTKRCKQLLEEELGAGQVLLTTSCTTAMDMWPILLDMKEGDEVILPSYTFVSTANAFVNRGVKPVFVDVDAVTLNIDPVKVEAALTAKTRAVVAVHYAGVSCAMDELHAICADAKVSLLEDAAQGVGAKYKGRYLGTLGQMGAYSFHETKNYICGEGGALIINDESLRERAEIIREKGTNRSKFFRGMVDKYTWVDKGYSALPSDILAAYLYGQLEQRESIAKRRKAIYENYYRLLSPLAQRELITLPSIPDECESNHHMFFIRVNKTDERQPLLTHLKSQGVGAVFHYVPLHTSPVGRSFGYKPGDLPITEVMSERLIRLPFFYELGLNDQEIVCAKIADFYKASL